jgi:arylsulfatase
LCTPYQWTKQVASHWGGTRNGTIVRWGNGLGDGGGIRHQFHHVIDIVPTILEAAGIPAPQSVNGITQAPLEGVSMLGSLRSADAPETHDVQYFEIMGNRGIYFQGWTAVTKHRTPWKMEAPLPFDQDVWELYAPDDWTQSRDLSKEQPEQLAYLQRLWLIEATKYGVVPLDDRTVERIIPELSGRPSLIKGTSQLMFSGMRLAEAAVISVKNRSHAVTAEVEVPEGGVNGVIVTQGGLAGGWALYAHEKKLTYCYNFFGIDYYVTSAEKEIPAGRHQVRMEFAYDGGGLALGGDITLFYDGEPVGSGRVDRTQPVGFSADEACDVGRDTGSSPSPDYRPGTSAFTGTIAWVEIDTGDDDHDHLVTAEDRLRIAMGKQ